MRSPDSEERPEDLPSDSVSSGQTRKPNHEDDEVEQGISLDRANEIAREVFLRSNAGGVSLTVNEISGGVNFGNVVHASTNEVRQIFIDSVRKRDDFMSTFLSQALQQAGTAFNLSIYFMILGGLIVLVAASLAVSGFAGSPSHGIALVSGVGGLLIGTSGAAFSRRADKARKHLAQQAVMMQSQLLSEQKFSQVIDLLTGVRDDKLNDQARITLAARLMGELNENSGLALNIAVPEPKKRRGASKKQADLTFGACFSEVSMAAIWTRSPGASISSKAGLLIWRRNLNGSQPTRVRV